MISMPMLAEIDYSKASRNFIKLDLFQVMQIGSKTQSFIDDGVSKWTLKESYLATPFCKIIEMNL